MWKRMHVALAVVGLSLASFSPAAAQGPGRGGGPFGGGPPNPEAMAQRMMQMRERMLDQMPLTDAEKAAAKAALKAKGDARAQLARQLQALQAAVDDKAAESAMKEQIRAFAAANAAYYKAVAEADQKLLEKVSPAAGAQLAMAGFTENGAAVGAGAFGGFPGGPGGFPGGPGGARGAGRPGAQEGERITPPAPGERIRQDLTTVGELAPDFTLISRDGHGKLTLADNRGKRPVVLIFGSYT